MSREVRRASDDGNALVEFLLVSILVVALAMGVIQLAIGLYVRNMLSSAAAEGARLAATNDRTPDDGIDRASELVAITLGDYPAEVTAGASEVAGAPAVTVTVTAPMPLVGMWGAGSMTVAASSLKEADRG